MGSVLRASGKFGGDESAVKLYVKAIKSSKLKF